MEHSFGSLWDDVPTPLTSTALLRESALIVLADVDDDALAGSTVEQVDGEWVLYASNGREVARSKDKALLEDYRNNRTSMRKGAPFAGYSDFDACVAANGDKDDPDAYCATIMRKVEKEAARPKGNRAPTDEPTQQPMRPVQQIRTSPSADQLKARKQMSRKQAAVAYEDRDPNEMSRSCAIGEHDDEDFQDTTCVCPCHDHWGVPEQYREGWQDEQYHQPPFDRNTGPHPKYATRNKESAMRTEAQILREMATASLADQRTLAVELDTVRRARTASVAADREVDLADTIVRAHLTPVRVHAMHTTATDWVDTEEPQGDPTLAMKTEATLWFQRTSAEVREDADEFATQATGMATRLASQHGEQADAAFEAFIGHVDHLYTQAAKVAIDAPDPSGQAVSKLPEPDEDDPYLSEDWDGNEDTGVHPEMPGATGSKTAADDSASTCAQCGASIERDPAGEDPRTWHHNDGDSHDHEASPKTAAKTAANDAEESQYISERNNQREAEGDESSSEDDDEPEDDDSEGEDKPEGKEASKTAGEKVDEDDPAQGESGLPTAEQTGDTEPLLAEDWDHQSDDPETGTGAADVADVPTPGEDGYPKPKNSMLDKAAAFRATVQKNLER